MSSLRLLAHDHSIQRFHRLWLLSPLLLFLMAAIACSSLRQTSSSTSNSAPQPTARIELTPASATVPSKGTLQFTALIRNSANTGVRWTASAGTISPAGLFYAPDVSQAKIVLVTAETSARTRSFLSAEASISVIPKEPLSIVTHSIPAATSGRSYSADLNGSGGTAPYSWSITAGTLPPGVQLNGSNGVLSGTPTKTGSYAFSASVKDASSHEVSRALTLTVSSISTSCVAGPPDYLCSTNSTAHPGTIAPIFKSTAPTATSCSGMCQNSTAYDTTLNPSGTDCITRITDGTTFPDGHSMGNLTFSGGDNDVMGSVNETYLGVNSSQVYILHMDTSGNCIQVMNPGVSTMHVAGPFGFSKVNDKRFYYLVNKTQLYQADITGTVPNETFTSTLLVDLTAAGVTPGIDWSTWPTNKSTWSGSVMGISDDDNTFGWAIGPSTQGSADWEFVYDRRYGVASVNYATGRYWNFCTGGSCERSTASGTLTGGCWGSQGSIMHGIHDVQMSGNGQYMLTALQVKGISTAGWTRGQCANNTLANQQVIWQIGTANTQWAYSNPNIGTGAAESGSHHSAGSTHYVTPYYGGPNIRSFSDPTNFTQFAPRVTTADMHGTWVNPLHDDSYPWVGASDATTAANGAPYAPTYMNNVVFAWFPQAVKPPVLFSHTFSCGTDTIGPCIDGGDAAFGAQYSIGFATQKGNYFCWVSTHLHNLGKDSLGNPRADGFCVHLQ